MSSFDAQQQRAFTALIKALALDFGFTENAITADIGSLIGSAVADNDPQSANLVFAGPSSGPAAVPTYRALVAADLPNTAVTAGSYGDAAHTLTATVDAMGRLTAMAAVSIAIAPAAVTGTAVVTADVRLPPAPSANGNLIYDTGAAYATIAAGATGTVLRGNGGASPTFGAVNPATDFGANQYSYSPVDAIAAYGPSSDDGSNSTAGTLWQFTNACTFTGWRVWVGTTSTYKLQLWDKDGTTVLATKTVALTASPNPQNVPATTPVALVAFRGNAAADASHGYMVSFYDTSGAHRWRTGAIVGWPGGGTVDWLAGPNVVGITGGSFGFAGDAFPATPTALHYPVQPTFTCP